MMRSIEGRRENRMQRASFELLWGALCLTVKRPSGHTQKGTPYGVGVHVDENREGTECSGQALS